MPPSIDTTVDPWQAALDAKEAPQVIYGEVMFDMYSCALVKGTGKVPFDPTQHAAGQRRTAVKVGVYPLIEMGLSFATEREFIAENGGDGWLKVTLPSLKALNVTDLRKVNKAYAKAEIVAYGTYTKKDNGETRSLTAPKFLALYATQEECLAAFVQESGYTPVTAEPTGLPLGDINDQLFGENGGGLGSPQNGHNKERETALAFLPAIVRQCFHVNRNEGIDTAKLEQQLNGNALLSKYFNMASPEVMEAVTAALKEPAF